MVAPAGTKTNDGTWAAVLLLENTTVAPFAGAEPVRVTVPVIVEPPGAGDRLRVRDWT